VVREPRATQSALDPPQEYIQGLGLKTLPWYKESPRHSVEPFEIRNLSPPPLLPPRALSAVSHVNGDADRNLNQAKRAWENRQRDTPLLSSACSLCRSRANEGGASRRFNSTRLTARSALAPSGCPSDAICSACFKGWSPLCRESVHDSMISRPLDSETDRPRPRGFVNWLSTTP
jgi:hypothetical protein